jgi:hypothetical protein
MGGYDNENAPSKGPGERTGVIRKTLVVVGFMLGVSGLLSAADTQGVIAPWDCVKRMVENGRAKTLRDQPGCSLMHNYRRETYGLITGDKKYYRLDDPNNEHILQLLEGTPDKDNLRVVVTGDIDGDTIKVVNMTML